MVAPDSSSSSTTTTIQTRDIARVCADRAESDSYTSIPLQARHSCPLCSLPSSAFSPPSSHLPSLHNLPRSPARSPPLSCHRGPPYLTSTLACSRWAPRVLNNLLGFLSSPSLPEYLPIDFLSSPSLYSVACVSVRRHASRPHRTQKSSSAPSGLDPNETSRFVGLCGRLGYRETVAPNRVNSVSCLMFPWPPFRRCSPLPLGQCRPASQPACSHRIAVASYRSQAPSPSSSCSSSSASIPQRGLLGRSWWFLQHSPSHRPSCSGDRRCRQTCCLVLRTLARWHSMEENHLVTGPPNLRLASG